MSDAPKDLYVSAVQGHLVTRYGTGTLIGATRDPKEPSQVTWDTELVVKISEDEALAYGREYRRALAQGSLKARTKADYDAESQRLAALTKKDAETRAKAEAKAKADAEAKAKSEKKE